jgi:hypothetical protein
MNDPFDWKNYKPQISMRDLEKARRNAYQMTRYVNEQRKKGVEPSAPYSERTAVHLGSEPKDMVVEMPVMPLHKRSLDRKARKK